MRTLLGEATRVFGHGPKCPRDCVCRVAETALNVGVTVLERSAAKRPRAKAAERPRAKVIAEVRVECLRVGEITDAEILEEHPAEVDGAPRALVMPLRKLPGR